MHAVDDVLRRIEDDGVEYIRFEASNCNGQSLGKTVPVRHIAATFRDGLPIYCGSWFFTALFGNACDVGCEGLTYRNAWCFPYPETYRVVPYSTGAKVARIMMYPLIDKLTREVWPIDPRSICLRQLAELKGLGFHLLSAFEHEFQVFDATSLKPLWSGKEFCGNSKFAEHEDLAFSMERALLALGVDVEQMHVEWGPGQYELPVKAAWGIAGADDSFTLRTAVKQLAHKQGHLASFATTPGSKCLPDCKGTGCLVRHLRRSRRFGPYICAWTQHLGYVPEYVYPISLLY